MEIPADEKKAGGADIVGRHGRLVRRTALVSILTLVSRLLGFVREALSAWLFGDKSGIYDAFITAWRIPNLFRRFLGEGALSTSFQTALTEVDADQGEAAGARLFRDTLKVAAGLLVVLCAVVMAAVYLMPNQMPLTGWNWLGADPQAVRDLTVRMMPYVVLICLSALVGGALNVRGHFSAPAWAPAIMNIVWIAFLVLIAARFGWNDATLGEGMPSEAEARATSVARHMDMTRLLAWGVLLAGLAQLLVQVPALYKMRLLGRGRAAAVLQPGSPTAGQVFRRSIPLAFGAAVYQVNVLMDGLMAEVLLEDGGPTCHYLANRVQQFPLALVAFAATAAVFPALQAHGHKGDKAAVRGLHDRTHRAIAFVALPAMMGLYALAGAVVVVSFEHGGFEAEGVARTTDGLRMLCLAILPAGASGLVARTYYAMGDFKSPVRISVAMLCLNFVLNIVCIESLHMDVDGLALATTVTSWGTLLLLLRGLGPKLGLPAHTEPVLDPLLRMLVAALLCGLTAAAVDHFLGAWTTRAIAMLVSMPVGGLVYFGVAAWLRIPESQKLWQRFSRKS